MNIRYTIVNSPLGWLLLAATERGICAVSMGDDDAQLRAALAQEYPRGVVQRADEVLRPWADEILRYLSGQHLALPVLPLDVQASVFQWRVWRALQHIPAGETRTYRALAETLDTSGAARAVGRACATNPVALLIPCHRAVRADGGLGGYRWGLERKQRLLAGEAAAALDKDT